MLSIIHSSCCQAWARCIPCHELLQVSWPNKKEGDHSIARVPKLWSLTAFLLLAAGYLQWMVKLKDGFSTSWQIEIKEFQGIIHMLWVMKLSFVSLPLLTVNEPFLEGLLHHCRQRQVWTLNLPRQWWEEEPEDCVWKHQASFFVALLWIILVSLLCWYWSSFSFWKIFFPF